MTPLYDILQQQITRLGPLSIAEYMAQCLYHPAHGYYTNADPLGRSGDFITAPEISQMFGEMIGLSLAQSWLDQGAPTPFCLAELGPGSGQLMADILRATARVPGFHKAARLYLCEINPNLKTQQIKRLENHTPKWIGSTPDLPELPLFLVANEFFDCLPILQFVRTDTGWDERVIGVQDGKLTFAHRPAGPTQTELPQDPAPGTTLELCPSANAIGHDIGRIIASQGGCALIFDYGGTDGFGDSFQALRHHQKVDVLEAPGQCDLTAHVNFAELAKAAAPAQTVGPVSQGVFLERLGITARAQTLAEGMSGDILENHITAHRRLTHPDEMGKLFKTLALVPSNTQPPVGFI